MTAPTKTYTRIKFKNYNNASGYVYVSEKLYEGDVVVTPSGQVYIYPVKDGKEDLHAQRVFSPQAWLEVEYGVTA